MLKKMSDAARSYYNSPNVTGATNSLVTAVVAKQFPATHALTPSAGCCATGATTDPEKCAPSVAPGLTEWSDVTWKALDFKMTDPHYYAYAYTSTGAAAAGNYTAGAQGDLDCDGTKSSFTLYAEVLDGEVNSAGDVIKNSPLE
jgi:hypothetical protein